MHPAIAPIPLLLLSTPVPPKPCSDRRTRLRGGHRETQTDLPPPPPGASFSAVEQEKYRQFKEAYRGAHDYMAMEGEFRRYLRMSIPPRR